MPPLDIYSMTPEEVQAEAERRRTLRAEGQKLDAKIIRQSQAAIDRDRMKLEREIQSAVVATYRAFGFIVYTTSQPKQAKVTPGIPDVYAMHERRGFALWHETKTLEGALRPAQAEFRTLCLATKQLHTYGGVSAAEEMLESLNIARRIGACLESISPIPGTA